MLAILRKADVSLSNVDLLYSRQAGGDAEQEAWSEEACKAAAVLMTHVAHRTHRGKNGKGQKNRSRRVRLGVLTSSILHALHKWVEKPESHPSPTTKNDVRQRPPEPKTRARARQASSKVPKAQTCRSERFEKVRGVRKIPKGFTAVPQRLQTRSREVPKEASLPSPRFQSSCGEFQRVKGPSTRVPEASRRGARPLEASKGSEGSACRGLQEALGNSLLPHRRPQVKNSPRRFVRSAAARSSETPFFPPP